MMMQRLVLLFGVLSSVSEAHVAAWTKGAYCLNRGPNNETWPDNGWPIGPLYNLTKEEWWFQRDRGCTDFPPPAGDYLEIPANGNFTVELAANQAFTTFSHNGQLTSPWTIRNTAWDDGTPYSDDMTGSSGPSATPHGCLAEPLGHLHTRNRTHAAGTAFAISYHPLENVTMENLVVFSVKYTTPWKRLTTYSVPDLPAGCPAGGCTCAWLWVPDGCGQQNIYMQGHKCIVKRSTSGRRKIRYPAKAPVFCDGNPSKCVSGPKQMIVFTQKTGNNIQLAPGQTPGYNQRCGFNDGAQHDIFG